MANKLSLSSQLDIFIDVILKCKWTPPVTPADFLGPGWEEEEDVPDEAKNPYTEPVLRNCAINEQRPERPSPSILPSTTSPNQNNAPVSPSPPSEPGDATHKPIQCPPLLAFPFPPPPYTSIPTILKPERAPPPEDPHHNKEGHLNITGSSFRTVDCSRSGKMSSRFTVTIRNAELTTNAAATQQHTISPFRKCITHYEKVGLEQKQSVQAYVKDSAQKSSKNALNKAITSHIDIVIKQQVTNEDYAKALYFFMDLLQHKPIPYNESDAETTSRSPIVLEKGNEGMYNYALATICGKFISMVKLNNALLECVEINAFYLSSRFEKMHEALCVAILEASTLLRMDKRAILEKLRSFPPSVFIEAATNWVAGEQAALRLFLRVHNRLDAKVCKWAKPSGMLLGAQMLSELLNEVLDFAAKNGPIAIATALTTTIILEVGSQRSPTITIVDCGILPIQELKTGHANCSRKFEHLLYSRYLPAIREQILRFDWAPALAKLCEELGEVQMQSVLKTRHAATLVMLETVVEKFEHMEVAAKLKHSQQQQHRVATTSQPMGHIFRGGVGGSACQRKGNCWGRQKFINSKQLWH